MNRKHIPVHSLCTRVYRQAVLAVSSAPVRLLAGAFLFSSFPHFV